MDTRPDVPSPFDDGQMPIEQPAPQASTEPLPVAMPVAPVAPVAPTAPMPVAQSAPVATAPEPAPGPAPFVAQPAPAAAPPVPPQPKKPASAPKVWALVLVAALISAFIGAAVAVGVTLLVTSRSGKGIITSPAPITSTNNGSSIPVSGESASLSEAVAQKALPSVVSITVSAPSPTNPFTNSTALTEQDSGSGVIIKPDGYIITNNHVIAGGTKIVVNAGGKNYTAKVVGADPGTDIAVLKIEASGLPAIDIGASKDLKVGQYVMAIGCPFGLEKSVSTGIISGLGRSDLMATDTYVTAYTDLIQTDAAINPGNSGGALVDQNARLIGINALINSTSGSSAGVGFAIPIDTAIDIANQIISTGKVVHPFLGVSTQTVTSDVAQAYKMPVEQGAYVINVSSGSPAAAAGLKQDDIITKINSTNITSSDDVFKAVRSAKIGDTITITYYRGKNKQTTKATLASDSQNQQLQQQQQQQQQQNSGSNGQGNGSTTNPHGNLTPQELQDLLQQYGLGGGSGN